ncbi:MAG: hypothetical protein JWO33_2043 [Caulobacteraceae bacterium]|nr:hypothetical protein [Caulobacteraceae bacterium]
MRKITAIFAAASLAGGLALATSASAQFIDKAGNCHAANGQMAKMSVCKPAPKGPCKDPKTGHFISCAAVPKGPCKDPKTGQFVTCKTAPKAATPARPAAKATPAVPAKPATPAVPPTPKKK